jgi:hypothetical protein
VDLSKSLSYASQHIAADTSMNMNGMGVYMNVIRESEDISKKKEMLSKQKNMIMGMSF